jgi:hypothetical protein
MDEKKFQNDHDLLVGMSVKLDRAISDIADLARSITTNTDNLHENKVDKKEFEESRDDHERRIRKMERYVWSAIAVLSAVEFCLTLYATIHK